jgi:Flp pilus assembly CpaF family ATPase
MSADHAPYGSPWLSLPHQDDPAQGQTVYTPRVNGHAPVEAPAAATPYQPASAPATAYQPAAAQQPATVYQPAESAPAHQPAPPATAYQPASTAPYQPTAAAPAAVPVDVAVVKALRNKVSERVAERIRQNPAVSPEQRRAEAERVAAAVVGEHVNELLAAGRVPPTGYESALLDAVTSGLFGLGPLQQLLRDPTVVNIHVVGCDRVRIEHTDGRITQGPPLAETDAELVGMLQMLAMRDTATERSFSSSKPWVDLQMPDGSRLTALQQVAQRPTVTIRRHTILDVRLEDLRDQYGVIDHLLCDFLKAAMRAGCNIMVAGLAAAGKTTMLRALASEIPSSEAFVTLEESRELGLHATGRHPWCISLEAREGHGDRGLDGRKAGEVTIADLIPLTLRMSARRIIVGEVRSREIVPMLQAMSTSRGSMCTIHAREPRAVMDRIIELALSHGSEMRADLARRMAAGALDLIVYLNIDDETGIGGTVHRYVSEVVEIVGMNGDVVVTNTIFGPGDDGRAVPRHLPERLREPLLRVGYDPRVLTPYIEHGRGAWQRPLQTILRRSPT